MGAVDGQGYCKLLRGANADLVIEELLDLFPVHCSASDMLYKVVCIKLMRPKCLLTGESIGVYPILI